MTPFLLMDFSAPSREMTLIEGLIGWAIYMAILILFPSLLVALVSWLSRLSRRSSPTTETTSDTDAAMSSLDDDWADIALQLKKENNRA